MGVKIANNAYGILLSSILSGDTAIALQAGHGARFPALSAGDYFFATLIDTAKNLEIVKVTARSGDNLTVVRGQDGTTAIGYSAGDRIEIRPCNATWNAMFQEGVKGTSSSGTNTYTATLSPVPTAYNTSQVYPVVFTNANTSSAPTLNLNSLGAKTIKLPGGATVQAGDIPAGYLAFLQYDGADFIFLNPPSASGAQVTGASGTDTYTATLVPAATAYVTDRAYFIKFPNANSSTTPTLNLNGLGAKTIKVRGGGSVPAGAIKANAPHVLVYDGTDFIIDITPGTFVPTGVMLDYAGTGSVPDGFLACDGSAVSRTTYANLYAKIGTTWGVGDGSTTFNLPDSRRRVVVGSGGTGTATLGNAVGSVGGAETHALTIAEMPAHTHTEIGAYVGNVYDGGPSAGGYFGGQNTGSTGGDGAHNNMQPSLVATKIIAY
jgi:microcystin-dependent protein